MKKIIAIDGHAATGKSSQAKKNCKIFWLQLHRYGGYV